MGNPQRWGVLSTAKINEKVLAGASLTPEADIVAVASRQYERAEQFAARWSIPTAYGAYDDLLADASVEAVYIPLPNGLHHEWTMRALAAGKHVLCEKPYSRHPEEVRAAFDLADASGLLLSEGYMYRYHPQIVALAELVASGAIGELRLVSGAFSWLEDAPGGVRQDPGLDGGSLLDVGCYCVSAARLVAGEPSAVSAQAITGPTGVEVRMVATMRFAGDVLAHFDSGFFLPDRSALEVVGTEGTVRVPDPWHGVTSRLEITRNSGEQEVVDVAATDPYRLELEQFARAVRGDDHQLLGRADALGQAVTIEALYRSAESGRTIDLPPVG